VAFRPPDRASRNESRLIGVSNRNNAAGRHLRITSALIDRDMIEETASDKPRSKPHILHVEDDPDVRLLIAASLQAFGYIVVTAGTIAEAMQLAEALRFDLCILDVRLPDGSGIDLCCRLRDLQPNVPILYYSAYASDSEQKEALSVCGDAYLKKPVSLEYLEQTIARLLGKHQS
jgi:CheY-like chemotaxis protein